MAAATPTPSATTSDDSNRSLRRWRRATDGPLLVLALASLPLLLLETRQERLVPADRLALDVVNIVVLVAFAASFVVELALVEDRLAHARREWSTLVIVASQALALAPALSAFGVLRLLRGARAARAAALLVRLFAVGGTSRRVGRTTIRRSATRFAIGLAVFTWVMSGVAFTLAEDIGIDGRLESFGDALWWAAATITTVGYGDVYPVTAAGRVVGVVTMVVGVSVFAILTAKVAEFLVRDDTPTDGADVGHDLTTS